MKVCENEDRHDVHYPSFTCYVDVIDEWLMKELNLVKSSYDHLQCYLVNSNMQEEDCAEIKEIAHYLESQEPYRKRHGFGSLGQGTRLPPTSLREAPMLELKPLPNHLRSEFWFK